MAQVPEIPQAAAEAVETEPQTASQPAPAAVDDALVKLYTQLEPISRGLAARARSDPKSFIMSLPSMISGTIVKGMLILIEEVGARDQDHEQRLRQLERHPLMNFGDDFDDDIPDPNDPAVLNALLGDMLEYMNILAGVAEKLPDQMGANAAIQRIETNVKMIEGMRVGISYVLEHMDDDDDELADEPEEGPQPDQAVEDMAPPEIKPAPEMIKEENVSASPEAKPEATHEAPVTKETSDGKVDEAPTA